MQLDAERKQLEKDLDDALAARQRLWPSIASLPKHFVAFNDAVHRYAEVMERCARGSDDQQNKPGNREG